MEQHSCTIIPAAATDISVGKPHEELSEIETNAALEEKLCQIGNRDLP
jgi:hypothetical protein